MGLHIIPAVLAAVALLIVAAFIVHIVRDAPRGVPLSARIAWLSAHPEVGAVTLAQAKLNTNDDIQAGVIDEFRKESFLLDQLTFDDAVTPGTNGATLTYGYMRLITQPTAAFRAYNADYVPQEVTKQRFTTELKPFGGAFEIDRVLAQTGGLVDEVQLQTEQKVKAARTLFHDAAINGDTGVDATQFDGLDKALAGSTTEMNPATMTDWTALDENGSFAAMDVLDEFLSLLDGDPTLIFGNRKGIAKIRTMARRAGYFTRAESAFGTTIERYGNIALVDAGNKPGSNDPIIPIESRDLDGAGANPAITGLTDLYAVRLGLDGFHGVSLAGGQLVRQYLAEFAPNYQASGAVRRGEIELVASVALKATKAAAVLRNVKVQ